MKKRNCLFLTALLFTILFASAPLLADEAATTADTAKTGGLMALSFDDGPSIHTDELLNALKERNVKATFFVVGSRIQQYSEEIKREYDEGHEIGCHTWSHTNLTKLDSAGIQDEINKTKTAVCDVVGADVGTMLLRPPGGSYNDTVLSNAGGPVILWSVDTKDWKYRDADAVKNNILANAHDGAVILLHDLYPTSIQGAVAAIDELQQQGYTFVTVSELFRRKGITLENDFVYKNAPDNGVDLGPPSDGGAGTNDDSDQSSDSKDSNAQGSKQDGKDDAFPWGLLIFCSVALFIDCVGMMRLVLLHQVQRGMKTNEKKTLRHPVGTAAPPADDRPPGGSDDLFRGE